MDTLIDVLATIGALTVAGVALLLLLTVAIQFAWEENYAYLKVFGFGFIKVRGGSLACDNLNLLRGSKGKTVFFDAPRWFNKHIYNFGVRPE